MIALLLPWVFGGALVAALAVGVLHLLSVQRPPELPLPTARFLPDRQVRAVSRTKRPSDMLLMAVRMAALLLAGLAAASPVWRSTGASTVALAVIDRGVGPPADTTAIREMIGADRTIFAFVSDGDVDSTINGHANGNPNANESAVWPVAWRAASAILAELSPSDSLSLHLFMRRAEGVQSPGALAWASTWPGRVIVHSPAGLGVADSVLVPHKVIVVLETNEGAEAGRGASPKNTDDGVVAALEWHAARMSATAVYSDAATGIVDSVFLNRENLGDTIAKGSVTARSTAASTAGVSRSTVSNRVRIEWPRNGVPRGWTATTEVESTLATANALVASGEAIVAPFVVSAAPRDSVAESVSLAWWGDGRVAARERSSQTSCTREVAVVVANASDVLLGKAANRFFERLLAPCRAEKFITLKALSKTDTLRRATYMKPDAIAAPQSDSLATYVPGPSVREFARRANISLGQDSRTLVTPVLLGLALLLLVIEGRLRGSRADADRATRSASPISTATSARTSR